jgi:hypothetical protein
MLIGQSDLDSSSIKTYFLGNSKLWIIDIRKNWPLHQHNTSKLNQTSKNIFLFVCLFFVCLTVVVVEDRVSCTRAGLKFVIDDFELLILQLPRARITGGCQHFGLACFHLFQVLLGKDEEVRWRIL